MTFLAWLGVAGALLLIMALSSALLRRLPITTSAIYLLLGLAIGPVGLGWIEINFMSSGTLIEHLTEIAVIVSLFVGGLKLRLPFRDPAWKAAIRLAGPVMLASIAGVAVFSHFVFGFEWGTAFLLGAILAPTDPVLASTVSVNDAGDHDRMRYGLSGEAGFNDGAAFPFVIFGLMWIDYSGPGEWTAGWALHRLIWAIPAGLIVGYVLGKGVGRLAIFLRSRYQDTEAPNDFLAMALIALAYVGSESIGAWGFLAAFAAGIGFRRAEIKAVADNPDVRHGASTENVKLDEHGDLPAHPLAEDLVAHEVTEEEMKHPARAAGIVVSEIISFGDTAERLMEVMLVLLVGVCIAVYWDWRAIPLAVALFFIIRPLSVLLFLAKSPTGTTQRLLMGWFGIRGIGSIYYLSYAMNHGVNENMTEMAGITLSVVALSIFIHGITSQPILDFYERSIAARKDKGGSADGGDPT
jgi:NhaP-type Na+/H+ or K+/H+ antiporter